MDNQTHSFLNDPPLPLLLRMATPNSIAFLVQAAVSLTEVWFIGQLGSTSLAAIALVFPLLMLIQTLSGGALGGAVSSAVARAMGSGKPERAEKLLWHALIVSAAGAILLLILFFLFGERFLRFLGGRGEILEQAMAYCTILFPAGIFLWLMGSVSAVYRGLGNMKFPAGLLILGAGIQVPLSGCLVLGAFGLPQLGVPGAAVSAAVSAGLISSIMIARLMIGTLPIRLTTTRCQLSRELFLDIFQVALPASLSPLLTVANILCLTAIVGSFGESALAGYGIGSRIEFLLIPLVFGLGAAMTSLVGMNTGAGLIHRAEQIGWIGGISAAVLAGAIGISLALSSTLWIPMFTLEPEIQASATSYLWIVGPCFAFNGLGLSLYFASQGAKAMFWPVVATFIRILLAVGGALLLSRLPGLGLQGVYTAAALAMLVYGSVIAASLKAGAWRHHKGDRS